MKSLEKEKMCIHCEGRIPLDATRCHHCRADQSGTNMQNSFHAPLFQQQSLEDSLTSLYTPPYQGKRPQFDRDQEPAPLFEEESVMHKPLATFKDNPILGPTSEQPPAERSSLLPILLLTVGANAMLLGLLQLLFSKQGKLTLEWNANHWFFYCLFAVPLLYFGRKKLKDL